jgi:hypothetical protein
MRSSATISGGFIVPKSFLGMSASGPSDYSLRRVGRTHFAGSKSRSAAVSRRTMVCYRLERSRHSSAGRTLSDLKGC